MLPRHNAGFVVSNQNGLGGTGFGWNDTNHNRHFDPVKKARLQFTFGGSIVRRSDLKRPHTDEGSFGVEFRRRSRSG
jgi:hypothetical protein